MHKLKQLSASSFLRLLFAAFTFAFFCSAFIAPDRAEMFTGLRRIMTESSKVSTNYFDNGGYAGTFLNAGLVCLVLTALYSLPKVKVNATSCLAFLLTAGFCFWGVNILNLWFGFLGVLLYCLVKRENPANQINAMVFTTGICPLFTDLMIRYPHADVVGFRWQGILLAIAVGLFIGFCLPAGLVHSPKMHKGYDLYSAAVPVGLTAFFVRALLYQALGGTLPGGASTDLGVSSWNVANVFCFGVFGLCIVGALVLGCRPKDYWRLLRDPGYSVDFSQKYGNAAFLMNVGVYGLFIVLYYNLIGATFNAVTFGCIFCMLACCCSGSPAMSGPSWWAMLPRRSSASGSVSARPIRRPSTRRPSSSASALQTAFRRSPAAMAGSSASSPVCCTSRSSRACPCCTAASACITAASRRRSCACSSSRSSSTSSARRRSAGWRRQSARQIPNNADGPPGITPSGLYHWGVVGERRPRRPVPHCRLVPAAVKTARTNCVCSGGQ